MMQKLNTIEEEFKIKNNLENKINKYCTENNFNINEFYERLAKEYKVEWGEDIVEQMILEKKKNIIEFIDGLGITERYEHILNRIKAFDRIGQVTTNNFGSVMKIVQYYSATNIIVKFDNNYKVKSEYRNFKLGGIKSPYCKTVCNIGYLGEGEYKPSNSKGIKTKEYICWNSMFQRCYNPSQQKTSPTYKNCSVSPKWHNFQSFAEWFDGNYYEVEDEQMHLDKDILHKGNKIYSPENCIFTPRRINEMFTKSDANRGNLPIGVTYLQDHTKKFLAYCNIIENNKKQFKKIDKFDTPEEAFYLGYKPFKENYIKQVANEYKDKIPKKLYDAMYNWVVEITD